jgi:hypothetical protein
MGYILATTLAGDWSSFWGLISAASGMAGVIKLLAIVGVILAVFSLIMWLWEIRKAGGFGNANRSHHKLIFGFILGMVLAGPNIIIPVLLTLIGQIISGVIAIIHVLP